MPHQARLVGRMAEGLINSWGMELRDIRTRTLFTAPDPVDLAVTLHRDVPETREVGTALFERLI